MVAERSLFTREKSDGLYRVSTYLLAKMFDELIIATLATLVIAAFVFYGVQLQGNFALFWLVYLTTLSIGIGKCLFRKQQLY